MESPRRNKYTIVVLSVLLVAAVSAFLSQCEYTKNLERSIAVQDSVLKNGSVRDSVLVEKTKEYTKVITKYVSDCGFKMGDKSLSAEDVVKMVNNSQYEVDILKDSLKRANLWHQLEKATARDSLRMLNFMLDWIKNKYGIEPKLKTDKDGHRRLFYNISKADSALALFPYYKDKLRVDTAGNFLISVEKKVKSPAK